MPYEVDFIPVGSGEKCGDAIALRFGNLAGPRNEQTVVVIDGGFKGSGEALVQHIKNYYGTDRVDIVISTHPDSDHASGLAVVLEQLAVGQLLMHKPWEHSAEIEGFFKSGRVTVSGISTRIEESLQGASDLESLAAKKRIEIIEPFQGVANEMIHVLGPSVEYYETLLPLFRGTPEPIDLLEALAPAQRSSEDDGQLIPDHPDKDLLDDDEEFTSAENNSSTIILFDIDGHKLLFTGDAGKTALLQAAHYARNRGIFLTDLRFLDVPHHGSKRNMSSKVLGMIGAKTAFVSAAQSGKKHPAKKVTNALRKKGATVYVNRGTTLRHQHEAPNRDGWSPAKEEPFHNYVEE